MSNYIDVNSARKQLAEAGLLVEEYKDFLQVRQIQNGFPRRLGIRKGMVYKKNLVTILNKVKGK